MTTVPARQILTHSIVIEDSIFDSFTHCSEDGGAIFSSSAKTCVLKYNLFNSCSATHGGAVALVSSGVFLYSSCFSSCSAREISDNGGNAFFTISCSIIIDLMSSFKCAPDTVNCGDAVFQMNQTEVNAIHTNFSSCHGFNGECCFGSNRKNDLSRVSYMNVVDCKENSMYMLPGSTLSYSNVINNKLSWTLINGNAGVTSVLNSYFFGNTAVNDYTQETAKNNVKYSNCFGDIIRVGVNKVSNTETQIQTIIMVGRCHYGKCANSDKRKNQNSYIGVCIFLIALPEY